METMTILGSWREEAGERPLSDAVLRLQAADIA